MLRRPYFVALAVAAVLTGCHGPGNITAPQPPDNGNVPPQTIVPDNQLTPAGTNEAHNQYGGAGTDIPSSDDDDTCEPS